MRLATIFSIAATLSAGVTADIYLGFNSGATFDNEVVKKQADFEKEFKLAQQLQGSPGTFNSIRLYTNVQGGTQDTPIEAFPAAISTQTKLLLGIWCSGTTSIDNELKALTEAITQYGKNFTDLVVGLSVGSEDMYRVSVDGVANKAGVGQDASTIVGFIQNARDKLKNTALSGIPVGHVDTWSTWTNESNKEVIDKVDFVGTNLFPYYESDKQNDFSNASYLFHSAINATEKAAGDKPVWITETGWPTTGPDFGEAKASTDNAQGYWSTVGCSLFGKRNTWWYVLQDSNPANKAKFGITKDFSTTAQYNLTCSAESGAPSSGNNSTGGSGNGGSGNGTTGNGNSGGGNKQSAGYVTPVSWGHSVALFLSMVLAAAAWLA
ncbi:glycoside hydrolase family 17 protein [Lophiostoma macrostomum CBS 122681]|uniref:Glycoside hydrolase family 17 protein n=1 Tax=Lophiostoma macrostomum CBS 122681 TaxID=1314788 RepID=A0A6A6TKF3_9PLEO|nr:glycoside hydrolase family 17 protein [Lophiostoma macrostomum CBS 122681]